MVQHAEDAAEQPRPPAAAYYQMLDALPLDYFRKPPPATGVIATVRGRDNVRTEWAMSESDLARVRRAFRFRRGVAIVSTRGY